MILPAPPAATHTAGIEHVTHLSPYPDQLLAALAATAGNPVAHYNLRESVQLAFLAAVHRLRGVRRAPLPMTVLQGAYHTWHGRMNAICLPKLSLNFLTPDVKA